MKFSLDMLLTLVERYHNEKEEEEALMQEEREKRDMQNWKKTLRNQRD